MKARGSTLLPALGALAILLSLGALGSARGADPMTYKEISMLLRNKEQEQFILNDTARRKLLHPLSPQEEQTLSSQGASAALLTALRSPELLMNAQSAASYNDELLQRKEATLRQQQLQEERTRQMLAQQTAAARALAAQQSAQPQPGANPAEGKPLELKFTAFDGTQVDLSKLRGKVVLVQFWATWCGPCMAEVPHVVKAFRKYHDKGFEIVGVSLDQNRSAMLRVAQEKGMTWPQYFDGKGWNNAISTAFNIHSIPALWMLNKQGVVVTTDARRNLEQIVEKLLAQQ